MDAGVDGSRLSLVRLTEVPLDDVVGLLDEPRLRTHMPLSAHMTRDEAAHWVQTKDAQWAEHGYGPWAVLLDGTFAGWAGLQAEPDGADLALVLLPAYWGSGRAVLQAVLARAFGELGLAEVLVSLPTSRGPVRALARYGFVPAGQVVEGTATFRRFRLTREAWAAGR